jgi:DNA-binding beta-propeller fold protein YncE
VAAVIGSVAAIAAVALRGDSDQAGAVSVPDHAAVAIDPTSGRVTATVPLGGQPVAALADGDSIWIANSTNRTLTRISDRTGTPTATIGLPAEPTGLALGAGRLWLASFDHRHSLTAVDPRSGDIQFSIPLRQPGLGRFAAEGRGANAVAFANRSVWVTVGVSGLLRLSPRGTVLHSFVVGPNATAVTAGAGSIWVALLGPAQIVEVDPLHNQVGQATNVGNMDRGSELWDALQCTIAATGASVWVPAYGGGGGGGVWRIDTIGHSVTAVIQTGGSPCDVAARDDEVWVTNPNNRELDEIDPTTDSVTRKITLTETPGAIAATGRHIWVTTN